MSPDRKLALLRNILTASEARAATIRNADEVYAQALRQYLDQVIANGDTKPEEAP